MCLENHYFVRRYIFIYILAENPRTGKGLLNYSIYRVHILTCEYMFISVTYTLLPAYIIDKAYDNRGNNPMYCSLYNRPIFLYESL